MHAADDGVYHVQLRGTIPTYIHYSKKCFARPDRDRIASGSTGSVRVIDGRPLYFTVLFCKYHVYELNNT